MGLMRKTPRGLKRGKTKDGSPSAKGRKEKSDKSPKSPSSSDVSPKMKGREKKDEKDPKHFRGSITAEESATPGAAAILLSVQ